jgi:hypothetical protein
MEKSIEKGFSLEKSPFLASLFSALQPKHLAAFAASLLLYSLLLSWQFGVIFMTAVSLHQIVYAWLLKKRGPAFRIIPFVGLTMAYYDDEYLRIDEDIRASVSASLCLSSLIVISMAVWYMSGSVFFATAAYYLTVLSLINLFPFCYFYSQYGCDQESLGFLLIGCLIAFTHERFASFLASVLLLGAFLGLFFLGNWLLFLAILIFIGYREAIHGPGVMDRISIRGENNKQEITQERKKWARFWIFFIFAALTSLLLILNSLPVVVPGVKSARVEYLGYTYDFLLRFSIR